MKTFYDLFCKYPVISMQYSVKYELGFIQQIYTEYNICTMYIDKPVGHLLANIVHVLWNIH